MSKLNEAATSLSISCIENNHEAEENSRIEEAKEQEINEVHGEAEEETLSSEDDKKNILTFTMLFNKYSRVLDVKRSLRNNEEKRNNKYSMFFNKEVTIRSRPEIQSKILQGKKSGILNKDPRKLPTNQTSLTRIKFCTRNHSGLEPQISEPEMVFPSASFVNVFERKFQWQTPKKMLNKRTINMESDSLLQLNIHPVAGSDLRIHNSLTSLSRNIRGGLRERLKPKTPSLTALDRNSVPENTGQTRFSYWEHLDDLMLMQSDADKRFNLQISRSTNDNNRRSTSKLKKEDVASASDSKLLYTDSECKKRLKKCDKKSRGDSSRKEKENGSRKQVQWKTEVDVIYFSTHQSVNGDRTGEVIGRMMEPLREEWEQQRKGFYAKMVPSHMERHIKDRFISLLKI